MVCRFSRVREKEIWQGYFLFCSDWVCFVFPVACCITSISRGLVRLFFDWRVLPRWFVMRCLVFCQERIGALDAGFCCRIFQRRVVVLMSILMFLRCFLLVFSCFLKFICNGFLEKRMSDEGFWIYVFCMENRVFWIIFCAVFLMFCGRRAGILEVLAGCSILCI